MVKLSKRLKAAAAFVSAGNVLADVGTDHGYVPIYLLQKKRIPKAIAMDINRGPLERAKEHIQLFGLENYIELRLSDGVSALGAGEAETILIAGMGGELMIHILKGGKSVCESAKELVLQPQSRIGRLREYLAENGYETLDEDIVAEEGKFYPMMRVKYQNECGRVPEPAEFRELSNLYGGILLEKQHPVLKAYLLKEQALYKGIYESLKSNPHSEKVQTRLSEVERILNTNGKALAYYTKKTEGENQGE